MTDRAYECHSTLAKLKMNAVVQDGRECVPYERRQEDQGDYGVVEMVIDLKVRDKSTVCGIVEAHDGETHEASKSSVDIHSRVIPSFQDLACCCW